MNRNRFEKLTMQELYGLVIKADAQSDEAMHYMLYVRMRACLLKVYAAYEDRLREDFEDAVGDFFLYLREGAHGDNDVPYEALLGVQHPDAFGAWMQSAFRNYLNNRVAAETKAKELLHEYTDEMFLCDGREASLTTERNIETFAHLIAFMLCVLQPRERFIMLRWMLTVLDKSKALPEKDMALAMGISNEAYRVIVYRVKAQLRHNLSVLMREENDMHNSLEMNAIFNRPECHAIATDIDNNFANLYNCLIGYYEGTMSVLSNAEAIAKLRLARQEVRGFSVHDASSFEYHKSVLSILRDFYWEIVS